MLWGRGGRGSIKHGGMEGMPPYRNQTQTTPHQGGQYCKKSYVGGDNNIERTQASRATPSPLPSANT